MTTIGYARVSSSGQSLELQREQLTAAGAERIFEEKRSGTTRDGREALAQALDWVRDGDLFLVTKLDRLARSVRDLAEIIARLSEKRVGFRVISQPEIDTTNANGRLFLHILSAFAEWENEIRRERQGEGIAVAKAKGVYRGRPKKVDCDEIRRLKGEGVRPVDIARRLNISRSAVYAALADNPAQAAG